LQGWRRLRDSMADTPFADLAFDPAMLARVTRKFESVLATSFQLRPHFLMLTRQRAVGERFAILERVYRELRGDLKWSWARIEDYLLPCLLRHLDGGDWSAIVKPDVGLSMWQAPAVPDA